MTKWLVVGAMLIASLALNALQYIGSPLLDTVNGAVEMYTGVESSQLSLQRAIEAQRIAHVEAVAATRRMATRRLTRIAARAPAEVASSFVGQIGIPVTTSLVAWDLYDLCVIGSELEALEAGAKEIEPSASMCGYDISLKELLEMADIDGLDGLEELVDSGDVFNSEVWSELTEYTESALEDWDWEDLENYRGRISNILQ